MDRALDPGDTFHNSNKLSTFPQGKKAVCGKPFPVLCCPELSCPLGLRIQKHLFTAESRSETHPSPAFLWPLSSLFPVPPLFFLGQTLPHCASSAFSHFSCHLLLGSLRCLSPGTPAVVLGCGIVYTFLNLSEPASSLVKFTFSLTERLILCARPGIRQRYQKDEWTEALLRSPCFRRS